MLPYQLVKPIYIYKWSGPKFFSVVSPFDYEGEKKKVFNIPEMSWKVKSNNTKNHIR